MGFPVTKKKLRMILGKIFFELYDILCDTVLSVKYGRVIFPVWD